MKNIDFIRKASLSVPVVGNHSVSEETPSPPKAGTFMGQTDFMFNSISMLFLPKMQWFAIFKGADFYLHYLSLLGWSVTNIHWP